MASPLKQFTADHRYLLGVVARQAGFTAPVAIDLDEFYAPILRAARKRELLPFDGVLVRDWSPTTRRDTPGIRLGLRLYEVEGVRFVQVCSHHHSQRSYWGFHFIVVDRRDYRRFYRIALRCRRDAEPPSKRPVLPADQMDLLWQNTIGYLDSANLHRIKAYGGRARRGVLLTGTPGNGKTMACRWIWEECRRRNWEWRLVNPDEYRQARANNDVEALFSVERRGVIFFDDMDLALRDRETVHETEDQSVFLTALDGISIKEGVVFVFTTNCALELIDRAFKRPGRIDLVLHLKAPDASLRRQLLEMWHEDIQRHLNLDTAVASTDGYSFAEIEELRNLMVMHFMENGDWSWGWALRQFEINRSELANGPRRHVGFAPVEHNGVGH